jgi:2-C-methyl-D-erythritol 4-phosphate cytidylyltransferase
MVYTLEHISLLKLLDVRMDPPRALSAGERLSLSICNNSFSRRDTQSELPLPSAHRSLYSFPVTTGAVIVAAGRSTRMDGADKLLAPLGGRPLIARTVRVFSESAAVDSVVVVVSTQNRDAVERALATFPDLALVLGGERRRDSVQAGLVTLSGCDFVVVHDGARPLVEPRLIEAVLDAARECGAALSAVPVSDTVKRSDDSGFVRGTVLREGLWLAQTPQAFRTDLLLRAHVEVEGDLTDDAAMLERLGLPVKLVTGSRRNIKVTTPEDLVLAEALIKSLSS